MTQQEQAGQQYGATLGGLAGTAIPIPVVGPMIGSFAGGLIGKQIGSLFNKKPKKPLDISVTQGTTGTNMFAYGGKMIMKGNTHENGGIPFAGAELEDQEVVANDYVFSNRLRAPGTNKTFAQVAKAISSPKKLLKLGAQQERMRESLSATSYKFSSSEPKKFADGGSLNYVPGAINLAMGIMSKPSKPNYQNVDLAPIYNMNTNVDISRRLTDIKSSYRNLLDNSRINPNIALAGQAKTNAAMSEAYDAKQQQEVALQNQKMDRLLAAGQEQRQINMRAEDMLNQAKANRVNMITTGMTQLGQAYQQNALDAKRTDMDKATLEVKMKEANMPEEERKALMDKYFSEKPGMFAPIAEKFNSFLENKQQQLNRVAIAKNNEKNYRRVDKVALQQGENKFKSLMTPVIEKPKVKRLDNELFKRDELLSLARRIGKQRDIEYATSF